MLAYPLDVGDEVPCRVVVGHPAGCAAAGATLVEGDHTVTLGIDELAMARRDSAARSAVEENDRHAVGIAAFLDVEFVAFGHLETKGAARLAVRIDDAGDVGGGHGVNIPLQDR